MGKRAEGSPCEDKLSRDIGGKKVPGKTAQGMVESHLDEKAMISDLGSWSLFGP